MLASIVRIALIAGSIFSAYKFYPRFQPIIEPILQPEVLNTHLFQPAIQTINDLLPGKFHLSSTNQDNDQQGQVIGASITNSQLFSNITNQVKQQAKNIADEQLDVLKKEAGKAFCQVLVEKVKSECGQ